MGSYVSVPTCKSHYNVTIDCNLETYNNTGNNDTLIFKSIGGAEKGQVATDPDIAGIGVCGSHLYSLISADSSRFSASLSELLRSPC